MCAVWRREMLSGQMPKRFPEYSRYWLYPNSFHSPGAVDPDPHSFSRLDPDPRGIKRKLVDWWVFLLLIWAVFFVFFNSRKLFIRWFLYAGSGSTNSNLPVLSPLNVPNYSVHQSSTSPFSDCTIFPGLRLLTHSYSFGVFFFYRRSTYFASQISHLSHAKALPLVSYQYSVNNSVLWCWSR